MKFAVLALLYLLSASMLLGLSFPEIGGSASCLSAAGDGRRARQIADAIKTHNFKSDFKFPVGEVVAFGEYAGKLIVVSDAGKYGSVSFVLDAQKGEVVDIIRHDFLGEKHLLQSPSGRFLLYKRYYPDFLKDSAKSDVLICYDLDKNSGENPQWRPMLKYGRSEAGKVIYPASEGDEKGAHSRTLFIDAAEWNSESGECVLGVSALDKGEKGFKLEEFLIVREVLDSSGDSKLSVERAGRKNCVLVCANGARRNFASGAVRGFYISKVKILKDRFVVVNGGDPSEIEAVEILKN